MQQFVASQEIAYWSARNFPKFFLWLASARFIYVLIFF
ncbi:hypothetical protein STRDD12_00128 [Streptococcus sp. DD12]|nr:hypothetical protein STRDD12_00128 [Streptococcus sp. DD12]